jgi:hypothetical protein
MTGSLKSRGVGSQLLTGHAHLALEVEEINMKHSLKNQLLVLRCQEQVNFRNHLTTKAISSIAIILTKTKTK